jgi:two-component system CheB/CheR fusion protein
MDGQKVQPDHVYVIQPNTQVAITDGVLSVTARPDRRQPHYPVDHFLRSLATVQGPYAAGVILSGTGSDGTLGIGEIKAAGGLTFAQDDASAQYPDMPRNAVASGAVDLVLPRVKSAPDSRHCLRIPISHQVPMNEYRRPLTPVISR